MSLAINTEGAREAVEGQIEAMNVLCRHWPGMTVLHTSLSGASPVDAIIGIDGEIVAVAEVKTRFDMTLDTLISERRGEWLVTRRKLYELLAVARKLDAESWGVLYLPRSRVVLLVKLFDAEGRPLTQMRFERTRSQETVNGGTVVRENAFINVMQAHTFYS